MSQPAKIIAVLLLLNVVLLAALLTRSDEGPDGAVVDSSRVETKTVTRTIAGPTQVHSVTNTMELDWAELESADYVQYIANLRSVGCPEETIRDIVIADINKLFAARWREMQPPVEPWRYWRRRPKSENKSVANAALRHDLEVERAVLIRELLGVNFDAEMAKYAWSMASRHEEAFGFLPENKRLLVQDWEGRSKIEQRRLTEALKAAGESREVREERMRELEQEQLRELGALLTPSEAMAYQLRHSELADQLRRHTDALEPSEREFRQLFDLLVATPDGLSRFITLRGADSPLNDPFLQPRIQEILGVERNQQFLSSALSPGGKEERKRQEASQRRESDEAAVALKLIADEEIARITGDASLPEEVKAEQIRLIRKERKRLASELKKSARPERK